MPDKIQTSYHLLDEQPGIEELLASISVTSEGKTPGQDGTPSKV